MSKRFTSFTGLRVQGVLVGPESLNQAVLDWSAQTVLRATSTGTVERLVDADFLGMDARTDTTKKFLDTLAPEHQETVIRLALETSAVPGAHTRCSVPALDAQGATRHLDIRFANAMNDPRVGSLLIYVQDGTNTATVESELVVQRRIADFAAAFAGSMTSELHETVDQQLIELGRRRERLDFSIGNARFTSMCFGTRRMLPVRRPPKSPSPH
jgi:hypothetical protein